MALSDEEFNDVLTALRNSRILDHNATIQAINDGQVAEATSQVADYNLDDLPTELLDPNNIANNLKTRQQQAEDSVKDVARRLEPILNPIAEVVNAANSSVYGLAFDAVTWPFNFYQFVNDGEYVTRPLMFENHTYMPAGNAQEAFDKAGEFFILGGAVNAAAKSTIQYMTSNLVKRAGVRQGGKPFTGTESTARGIVRDISEVPLSAELPIAGAIAAGGAIGKDVIPEIEGTNIQPGELIGEIVGGITAAKQLLPAVKLDDLDSYIKNLYQDYKSSTLESFKQLKQFYEFQFSTSGPFSEVGVEVARNRMRDAVQVSPSEASQRLKDAESLNASVAEQINDQGIFSLQRSLMEADPNFADNIAARLDHSAQSIRQEFDQFVGVDGKFDWQKFEAAMPAIEAELLAQQLDRLTLAALQLRPIIQLNEQDAVTASKEFDKVYKQMLGDIKSQENRLWNLINHLDPLNTSQLKKDVSDYLLTIDKTSNIGKGSDSPLGILEEITGRKIVKTSQGYRFAVHPKGESKGQFISSGVRMLDSEPPRTIVGYRSNLLTYDRTANAASEPSLAYDRKVIKDVQQIIQKYIDDYAVNIDPRYRNTYRAAATFTRKKHENISDTALLAKIDNIPEKTLQQIFKGLSASDIAVADRELNALFTASVKTQAGDIALVPNAELKSKAGLSMQKYVLSQLAKDVGVEQGANTVNKIDTFLSKFSGKEKTFPKMKQILLDMRKRAKAQQEAIDQSEETQKIIKDRVANDIFSNIAGLNPSQMIRVLLDSASPQKNITRFVAQLRKQDKTGAALEEFKYHVSKSLLEAAYPLGGKAATDFQVVINTQKQLEPLLTSNLFTKQEQTRLLNITKRMQANVAASLAKGEGAKVSTSILSGLAAKLVANQAVNRVLGSQSIFVSGAAADVAVKFASKLTPDIASNVLKEAFKNPELMNILLKERIKLKDLRLLYKNYPIFSKILVEGEEDREAAAISLAAILSTTQDE